MDLIKRLFPIQALKREIAMQQLRAYEGGKVNDFHRLTSTSASPNTDMENAGVSMRSRARYFDENLDIVTGLFDTLVINIVGNTDPIRPLVRKPDGTLHTEVNIALKRLWKEFSISPTICGQFTMLQAMKLAARAWLRDGEFLTRIVRGKVVKNPVVPLALELIEADYLPFDKSVKEEGRATIIQGVEIGKYNEAKAYHLLKENPGAGDFVTVSTDTRRILAKDMLHIKFVRRVHQVRGVTILHSSLTRLDDLKDYEESERIAARVAAAMTGYIQKPGDMGTTAPDGRTFEMSPGMVFDNLLPGETIGTIASNRPNPELINFRSSMLKAIAAGTGSNASTISRNYDGTYSAQRQELLETKPNYESLRQQFIDGYIAPIWREFIKMLLVAGKIDTNGINKATIDDVEMRGIDIGWIDPKKQADATETAIRTRITTRGQVIRDSGGDPDAIFAEIEEEEKRFPPVNPDKPAEQKTGLDEDEETE